MSQHCDSGFEMSRGSDVPCNTDFQICCWCPLKVEKSRTSAAAHRANSTSIYDRPYTTDLGLVTLKRDNRKEMSTST